MACRRCGSDKQQEECDLEINIHFPGRAGWSIPSVLIFPKSTVCLHCGYAEFSVPEKELRRLESGGATRTEKL